MLALTRQLQRACRRADFCLKSLQGSVQKYKQSPLKVLIPRRNMLKAKRTMLRFYLFRNTEYIGKWHQKYRMYREHRKDMNYELFIKPNDVLNGKCNTFYSALEA
ncbi:hypothetical protein T08_12471 [Trichinella sp. T8]|nr:hypothetical protein T08_12471 [Trichinella sp. T8]